VRWRARWRDRAPAPPCKAKEKSQTPKYQLLYKQAPKGQSIDTDKKNNRKKELAYKVAHITLYVPLPITERSEVKRSNYARASVARPGLYL